jgi:hypothetical protein
VSITGARRSVPASQAQPERWTSLTRMAPVQAVPSKRGHPVAHTPRHRRTRRDPPVQVEPVRDPPVVPSKWASDQIDSVNEHPCCRGNEVVRSKWTVAPGGLGALMHLGICPSVRVGAAELSRRPGGPALSRGATTRPAPVGTDPTSDFDVLGTLVAESKRSLP